jgi:hypothetical protein
LRNCSCRYRINPRRKVVDDDDIVGDTGLGPSNDWEGIGTSGL